MLADMNANADVMTDSAQQAAARLETAAATAVPCAPVRDLIGRDDIALAYTVQRIGTERRLAAGATVVGRKIGLTSEAVQQQLGVHQPDFGVLFDDMEVGEDGRVPPGWLLQPKAEAELAFVLGADLDVEDVDVALARDAVEYATPALEIVDSRIANWDISFGDTVADNASSGMYVLGTQRLSLSEFSPRDVAMTMWIDGEVVSTGSGAACLGDPLNALAWLARTAREFGEPLRAGQVILSGALGPMVSLARGSVAEAEITADGRSLGTVRFRYEERA